MTKPKFELNFYAEAKVFEGLKVNLGYEYVQLSLIHIYSGFLVHTLDLFFLCKVKDTSRIKAMDDVAESFWLPLNEVNPEEFGLDRCV